MNTPQIRNGDTIFFRTRITFIDVLVDAILVLLAVIWFKYGFIAKMSTTLSALWLVSQEWYVSLTWLSAAIRWFAKVKYNHVGTIVCWNGVPMVMEAVGRGIIPTPLDIRLKKSKVFIKRDSGVSYGSDWVRDIVEYSGHTPYDHIGLLIHQAVWTASGYTIWIGAQTPEQAEKRFYCYEFSAKMAGREYWWHVNPLYHFNSFDEDVYKN